MQKHKVAIGIIAVILGISSMSRGATHSQDASNQTEFRTLVLGLWSGDSSVRASTKARLVQLGNPVILPITDMLRSLITDPLSFEVGTDEESKRLLELRRSGPLEDIEDFEKLLSILISPRLKKDLVDVLRQIDTKETVRFLIEALNLGIRRYPPVRTDEMEMLIESGSTAVPYLNDAIAAAQSDVESSPGIEDWSREENRLLKVALTQERQSRIAVLLTEIGDKSSLPVLEQLLLESQQNGSRYSLIRDLENAIKQIKARDN